MAVDFLEEIYQEAKLITELKDIAELSIYQDGHSVMLKFNAIAPKLSQICQNYFVHSKEKATSLWEHLKKLEVVNVNTTIIGDIIIKNIIPLLEDYININGRIEVKNDEEDYVFESTDVGFLTIKDINKKIYLHSISDPMWEAKKMAEYIFNPKKKEYAIWGCGLGYLAYQLYNISYGSVIINIFEPDRRMIEYAKEYGVLSWIPEENINIVIDEDVLPFLQCAERENTEIHIFKPILELVPEDVKQIICNLYTEYLTGSSFKRIVDINFWRNIETDAKLISYLDSSNFCKEYVVVAAGPSLDATMDFVRDSKGKRTIIAVGTVFKKLIENKIEPDMVVILDPQERTYKQIEGLENEKVPMLLAISAYWKFAAAYKGDKYLIPTTQSPDIVKYAIEHKEDMWACGGTVTSLGIEAAIQFKAEKVYLVGADFAYPNGVSHASGTMDRKVKETKNMILVEGVSGEKVFTETPFIIYREWIENRIEQTPHITYYNMSKIGAKIKGTNEWQEC